MKRTQFFITWAEFEMYSIMYSLQDGGMSGVHQGYHWFYDVSCEVDVYVK